MDRCTQRNINLNLDKIKLGLESVSYLGHIVLKNGLRADPSEIQAIREKPTTMEKQAVQRLLGMVKFVKRFVHLTNRLETTSTLPDLLNG